MGGPRCSVYGLGDVLSDFSSFYSVSLRQRRSWLEATYTLSIPLYANISERIFNKTNFSKEILSKPLLRLSFGHREQKILVHILILNRRSESVVE